MIAPIGPVQEAAAQRARHFAAEQVLPRAAQIDQTQTTPPELVNALRRDGWLGAALPERWGGQAMDALAYGLATEEFGYACASIRTLLTVHNMAAQAIARFGSAEQQAHWLPSLCSGERIVAFALTEPGAGSDAGAIAAEAEFRNGAYFVTGTKIWISYGLLADVYLLFARCEGKPVALIVERDSAGLLVEPMPDVLGTRGSMLARLKLDGVAVPAARRIGVVGAGLNFVASAALDHGRASVAWGSVGLIRACLDACVSHASERRQGGAPLAQHQLIRRQLTDALLGYTSARALCVRSAQLRMTGDPRAPSETALAKYHAAETAIRAAGEAVALHGAQGCSAEIPVSRYLRDATVMGIIEGTREMHQISLATYALQRPYEHG